MSKTNFFPEEVFFAASNECNLHCPHCFITRKPIKLSSQDAIHFLESCKGSTIRQIGFSGGEPFLQLDFLLDVIKYAVDNAFMFDRIMTNGIWWKTKEELYSTLQALRDAGYDGKIGLSFDSFHGQKITQLKDFSSAVFEIFDGTTLQMQSVVSKFSLDITNLDILAREFDCTIEKDLDKTTGIGTIIIKNNTIFIPIERQPQSFASKDTRAWKSDKWFKDDYCEGPGQVLYIHPDGNIAPCCGFANENEKLFIGNIKQDFDTVMHQSSKNEMIKTCFKDGLSKKIKELKKQGIEFPGKTEDICAFCDFVCNH